MRLNIPMFQGMRPMLGARALEDTEARAAVNCRLGSGEVRPWRAAVDQTVLGRTGFLKTIFRYNDASPVWLSFANFTSVVRIPAPGDLLQKAVLADGAGAPKIISTVLADTGGGGPYPEGSHELKIPTPGAAPTATPGGAGGSGDDRKIYYVSCFVREWGDQTDVGAPSPVSSAAEARDGETVSVSNLPTSAGAGNPGGVTHVHVYRAYEAANAQFLYAGKVALGTGSFSDSAADEDLGMALPSTDWDQPPDDLHSIVLMGDFLAGLSGNQVCFCEPERPHAWPMEYRRTLDRDGVALGVFGDNTLVAATANRPFIMSGSSPASMSRPQRLPSPAPCLSARGLVSTTEGVLWPSTRGLFVVGPAGGRYATRGRLDKRSFMQMHPATMHAAVYDNLYFGFWDTGSVVNGQKLGAGLAVDLDTGEITELGFYAHALFADEETDELYFVAHDPDADQNTVRRFDAGGSRLKGSWRSKTFAARERTNLAYARLDAAWGAIPSSEDIAAWEAETGTIEAVNAAKLGAGTMLGCEGGAVMPGRFAFAGPCLEALPVRPGTSEGAHFKLYGDDGALRHEQAVVDSVPFPLPGGFKDREFSVEVAGDVDIEAVAVATSVEELL